MIIQCPQCQTQARLSENQEGAKVRCSECERVYVAHPVGSRGTQTKSNPLPIYLAVGGGLVVVFILVMMNSGGNKTVAPVSVEPMKEVAAQESVDYEGWESAPVVAVRNIHRAALAYDEAKLRQLLDGKLIWERVQAEAVEAKAERDGKEPVEGEAPIELDPRTWGELAQDERATFVGNIIEQLSSGSDKELVADWKPYDGKVVDEMEFCTVEVSVVPSGESDSTESRTVLWKLVRDGTRWKAFSWERFYTQAEIAELLRRKAKKTQKVTLTDGSVVFEGEPGPIEHYEDTSAELRSEIDSLFATLLDLELPGRKTGEAKRGLVAIGRPALPVLLTGLYTIPLETDDQAIQLNLIDQTLEEITGHFTTYNPLRLLEGGISSDELSQSGIKQWFGWYNRKGKRFVKNESEDLIDTSLTPRNDRERREYERALKDAAKKLKNN